MPDRDYESLHTQYPAEQIVYILYLALPITYKPISIKHWTQFIYKLVKLLI